jgi:PilZ domain
MTNQAPLGQEQRLTFRVTVRSDAGIDACIVLAGRKLPAVVGDISAEGLFVTLERGPLDALKVGSMVDVEVLFEGEPLSLFGIVRSRHEGGYGVHFPERDPTGRANPLNRFGRISAQLQRSSLSQRLKVLKLPE